MDFLQGSELTIYLLSLDTYNFLVSFSVRDFNVQVHRVRPYPRHHGVITYSISELTTQASWQPRMP
jgi:hypothetical protein